MWERIHFGLCFHCEMFHFQMGIVFISFLCFYSPWRWFYSGTMYNGKHLYSSLGACQWTQEKIVLKREKERRRDKGKERKKKKMSLQSLNLETHSNSIIIVIYVAESDGSLKIWEVRMCFEGHWFLSSVFIHRMKKISFGGELNE